MYKGGDKVERFRLNEWVGEFKVIGVRKGGKLRSRCISRVEGLGEIVISEVYGDRKREYMVKGYEGDKIVRG